MPGARGFGSRRALKPPRPTVRLIPHMEFKLSTADLGGGVARVRVVGEVDLSTAPDLKRALNDVISWGARGVLVDLSDATFIDSTTLGVLMGAVKRLRPSGRRARDRLPRREHPQDLRDHPARPGLQHLRLAGRGHRPPTRVEPGGCRRREPTGTAERRAPIGAAERQSAELKPRRKTTWLPEAQLVTDRSSASSPMIISPSPPVPLGSLAAGSRSGSKPTP